MATTEEESKAPVEGLLGGLSVLLFWAIVIAVAVYFYTKKDRGEILLDISTQPERVSGIVIFEGAPVRGGMLHVVITEAQSRRYRAGTALPVGKDGKFSSRDKPALGIDEASIPLRITAKYRGKVVEREDGESKIRLLIGETTRYLNTTPPLGERFIWSVGIAMALLLVGQLFLFTGDLGPGKARSLFMLMYFFTFFALALPIAVSLVAAHEDLARSMEASPIGLVKAKTRVLSEPQWLVNIGGTVREEIAAPVVLGDADAAKPLEDEASSSLTIASAQAPQAGPDTGRVEPVSGETTGPLATTTVTSPPIVKTVEGGVAVPFYVVLLAMFGAGINMTLKVPVIQRNYEDVLPGDRLPSLLDPLGATLRLFSSGQAKAPMISRTTAGDIRRDLIENFMYLLSAPLLAIAMYYLLQVLAEEVTQPVLVLMAFATGLVSKAVVSGIIEFAESRLLTGKRREAEVVSVDEALVDAAKKQADVEAAKQDLVRARDRQAAAEKALKIAEAAVQSASEKIAAAPTEEAMQEAKKAEREAAAKRRQVEKAEEATAKAEQKVVEKQTQAQQAASTAAERAAKAAREAQEKESAARTLAKAAEDARVGTATQ